MCIELTHCPETRPEFAQACDQVALRCDYDTPPEHERCWCMNRFGEAQWECTREPATCPGLQPVPESPCTGDDDCFYATVSSLAYRCECVEDRWDCYPIGG